MLGEIDCGVGDRHAVAGDIRLGAGALACLERIRRQPLQDRASGPGLSCGLQRITDLREDLRLTQDHRVQPTRYPEDMPRGVRSDMDV